MNTLLMYLITVPVAVVFFAFVIGGGLLLPLWEWLDSKGDRRRTRDPGGADVIEIGNNDREKEKVAA